MQLSVVFVRQAKEGLEKAERRKEREAYRALRKAEKEKAFAEKLERQRGRLQSKDQGAGVMGYLEFCLLKSRPYYL